MEAQPNYRHLHTQIHIQAPAERVWQILMDTESYPAWNPFIPSLSGDFRLGGRLDVQLKPEGQSGMRFTPEVVDWQPGCSFAWQGHFWVKGIFDGRHQFRVEENGDGTTTLHQSEDFGGILVPFLKKMLQGPTRQGFEAMNLALKARAEA